MCDDDDAPLLKALIATLLDTLGCEPAEVPDPVEGELPFTLRNRSYLVTIKRVES